MSCCFMGLLTMVIAVFLSCSFLLGQVISGDGRIDAVTQKRNRVERSASDTTTSCCGLPGRDGRDGRDGIQGPYGPPGPPGKMGPTGPHSVLNLNKDLEKIFQSFVERLAGTDTERSVVNTADSGGRAELGTQSTNGRKACEVFSDGCESMLSNLGVDSYTCHEPELTCRVNDCETSF